MQTITIPAGTTVYRLYSVSTEGTEKLSQVNPASARVIRRAFIPTGVYTSKDGAYLCWLSWGKRFAVRKGDTVVTDYEATLRGR